MSGYKRATVTISEEEYRRLHRADMQQRFRGHTRTKPKRSEQTAEWSNALQQLEVRQQQLEQALSDFGQGVEQADAEVMQGILAQSALYYESLAGIIEENTSNTSEALDSLSQRVAQEMQAEREKHRNELNAILQRMDTYQEREHSKEIVARQWLRRSVAVADFIQEQFDHHRFCPGRLARILQSLDLAQNNLAQGLSEASLQISQQAFLDLSDLHLELEQRIVEWRAEFEETRNAIQQVLAELERNPSIPALGLQGEQLSEQVELAYWTDGKYRRLMETCRQFLSLLTQDQAYITTDELRRVRTELLPILHESFESMVYEARLSALNSQLRMNIAEKALQALESHGFVLNEAGYVDKDMRAPFLAQLGNVDGSQVTIQVLPTHLAAQELTNELVVITKHPHLKTEHEARLQWTELARSLAQYDLRVSHPDVKAAPPQAQASATSLEHPQTAQRQLIRTDGTHHVR